ncbi:MAG: alginate lyase family protein [Phycisphaerae bacterium]|nr:alginate lyase family protein [Phycisphaerae bacterium]
MTDPTEAERGRLLAEAKRYLAGPEYSVTFLRCPRSGGTEHDYYSEGPYWWPNPDDPDGPHIRRDGFVNPDAFLAHLNAMHDLAAAVGGLAVAYELTAERRWLEKVERLLATWFLDERTAMAPHLEYGQAIHGVCRGRGIGIIDTSGLIELTLAVEQLKDRLSAGLVSGLREWFGRYNRWLLTSDHGRSEKDQPNNHSILWLAQAAAFSRFSGQTDRLPECRQLYREIIIPQQVEPDGRMPRELARTRPFSYAILGLNGLAANCLLLSGPGEDLFRFETDDGRGLVRVLDYLLPYLSGSQVWPYPRPEGIVDTPPPPAALLLAGRALGREDWLALWDRLQDDPPPIYGRQRPGLFANPRLWERRPPVD